VIKIRKYCANCGNEFEPPTDHLDNPCCGKNCWEKLKEKQNGKETPEKTLPTLISTEYLEPPFRVKLTEGAKEWKAEITVRGSSAEEIEKRLIQVREVAKRHITELNKAKV